MWGFKLLQTIFISYYNDFESRINVFFYGRMSDSGHMKLYLICFSLSVYSIAN